MLPVAPDSAAQNHFFQSLFGEVELSSERSLVIWSPKGGTRFCVSIDEAAETCSKLNESGLDAYFAVSLQDVAAARTEAERIAKLKGMGDEAAKQRAKITRGFAATATVVPGVWLDVDYAGDQHAKGDLPPDVDAARSLVSSMPISPTLTVATGGGLHAYWLFHEPFEINNDDDRAEIAAIVYGGTNCCARSLLDLAGALTQPSTLLACSDLSAQSPQNTGVLSLHLKSWGRAAITSTSTTTPRRRRPDRRSRCVPRSSRVARSTPTPSRRSID
jgi:hypothetical protein